MAPRQEQSYVFLRSLHAMGDQITHLAPDRIALPHMFIVPLYVKRPCLQLGMGLKQCPGIDASPGEAWGPGVGHGALPFPCAPLGPQLSTPGSMFQFSCICPVTNSTHWPLQSQLQGATSPPVTATSTAMHDESKQGRGHAQGCHPGPHAAPVRLWWPGTAQPRAEGCRCSSTTRCTYAYCAFWGPPYLCPYQPPCHPYWPPAYNIGHLPCLLYFLASSMCFVWVS